MASYISPPDSNSQTGIDMDAARARSTIDLEPLKHFVYGSELAYVAKTHIIDILSKDPIFDKSRREYLSRTEKYHRGIDMIKRLYELKDEHGWTATQTAAASNLLDESLPMALHVTAFSPVFASQSRGPLAEEFVPLAQNGGIFGAYLQTELGHGSNVAKLETTATYIPETKEFEIHSPSLTAAKWWIGALGRTATHGVVQARLLLPSPAGLQDMGPHLFFVPLRSMEDHKPLPGITMGDIGPKALAGYATTDNGFAVFDHVRIPKSNMLDKFSQVTDEGHYVKPPHAKISYGGMLYIRSNMVIGAGFTTARGITVALRYCHVRRQGAPDPTNSKLEKQVITYPAVYYRLLPILSRAYVWLRLGRTLIESFEAMNEKLAKGDTSLLAEMHAITSGLKTLTTTSTITDLETARRSMGGHGYSAYAGVGRTYADYLPAATFEGDNFVLDLQVVRGALKTLESVQKSASSGQAPSLSPSSAYLRLLLPSHEPPQLPTSVDGWQSDAPRLVLLLEWRAAFLVQNHARLVLQNGEDSIDASSAARVSKGVTESFVATQVLKIITSLNDLPAHTAQVVKKLYILYLLTTLEGGLVDLLSFALIVPNTERIDPTYSLRMAIKDLCLQLLPESIGLSDAFALTDWELDSALGVYNGKAYEALWEKVKGEPMNNEAEITPAYAKSLKPMLERGQRKVQRQSKL
ncbi:peroxisomal oxidase [Flagelloscypha sp. PMI_526]|nr:peroxisomal oxidase [Flagelloscypha sp. PMI_526]